MVVNMVWQPWLKGTIVLAHRLKQARLRAGLSQEKLGKLSGIDPMSASARMNQYERGKHSPDYQLMCRVAEILQMPVSWFYTEDEEQARLQEIYFLLSPSIRTSLLVQAEVTLAANPHSPAPVITSEADTFKS
jgi:transcriptional regulator with XRE-family HTH domain